MSNKPAILSATEIAGLSEREALQRLELFTAFSRVLDDALDDYGSAMLDVVEACVPDFCDLCAIEVVGEGADTLVAAYRVASTGGLQSPTLWSPIGRSLAPDRKTVLGFGGVDEPERLRFVRDRLGAESIIVAPISAGGVTLGWLVVANGFHRRGFRVSALRVVVELSDRLGTAIRRVLLHREALASARTQARTVRRLRRLAGAATNLAGADTPEAVLRVGCVEACVVEEAEGAAARWWLATGSEVSAHVGEIEPAVMEEALASVSHGRAARGPGWVACPLPCTDPWQRGALALFVGRELSGDEEPMLSSLASFIPVAFERAVGTEATARHEARLRAVLEASPIALLTVRPNGTVASANQAAQQLFDWTSFETRWTLPDDLRPAVLQLAADVRLHGAVANRAVVSDRFDLSVSAAPMPAIVEDAERSVVMAATDLIERRSAERALLQAQRLEAMGQIAGRVAHDFNNLLTLIVGYSDILQSAMPGDRERDMLAKIDQAAKRAAALTQQMLGFTRRQLDTSVVIDVTEALQGLAAVIGRLAGAGITVSVDMRPIAVKVRSDVSEMEQIILNLVINACDAMEGSGALTLGLDALDANEDAMKRLGLPPGPYARLTVADTGPGMSEEVLARCTEPFFTTKERGRGSGLGLSTVYGLTVERGGILSVDSSPGRGTAVQVWIPRVDEEALAAPVEAGAFWPPKRRVRGRVLLVEDEDELRRLAVDSLTDIGAEVVSAARAETVLATPAGWSTFDVLITDIVLPGISGVELASRLRTAQPDLPVLYTTGYAAPSARQHGLVPGARLLRKPYRPDELRLVVASLLDEAHGSKR